MIVIVEVGVALSRPPRTDRISRIVVDVAMDPRRPDWDRAETEARLIAAHIASGRPGVVMPVSATVTGVTDV